MFAFITFKVTLGQDLEQWEGKARLCHSLTDSRSSLWETHPVSATRNCCKLFPSSLVSLKGHFNSQAAFCSPWMPWGMDAASLSARLTSHSYIWVSALGLEFTHSSCTLLPLYLKSVASPGPLDSPDPSFLAVSRCMGCCLCLILFSVFGSQCGGWGGIYWEQCQRQEARRGQTSYWIGVSPWAMCSLASPCPLSPCFALLLPQQRAQPEPWLLDPDICWRMAKTFVFLLHEQLGWDGHSFRQSAKKKVIFWPKQGGGGDERFWFLGTDRKYSFPNQFILLIIHHRILPCLLECCQHTWTKDTVFCYTAVFKAATKY